MKKILSLILALLMITSVLVACEDDATTPNDSETNAPATNAPDTNTPDSGNGDGDEGNTPPALTGTTYALNNTATWVKKLDTRMEATADYITCDWSASGIEFTATFKGDVTFAVNAKTKMGGGVEGCHFRAYIDGAAYLNGESPYYEAKGDSYITLKNVPEGTHTVKLVKATGYTLANVDLKSVTLEGTIADVAPANKGLFIEYVGDSISCGWGVVGNYDGAYTAQDATLAYPYLVSDTLGADYSVIAVSGQGIIKGNPGIAGGYKYASPYRSTAAEFGFERKANVVVINADTNDAYDNYPSATYITALKEFIDYVRAKNGADAHIVLVCNMMKTLYTEDIVSLVKTLGGAESKYYCYVAKTAAGTHSAHPTAEENVTYASEIGGMIKSILDGTYSDEELLPTIPLNVVPVYQQNFDTATNIADAGVTHLYGGTESPTVADGKLNIPKTAWGAKPWFELVSKDTFASKPGMYVLSMDLDVTDINNLSVVLGGIEENTSYKHKGAAIVQFKVRAEGSTADVKGQASAFNDGTKWIVVRTGYFQNTDGAQKLTDDGAVYARVIEKDVTSLKFNVTVVVDSASADGCNVHVFIDGEYVTTRTLGNEYDVTEHSSVYLWAENTVVTVDNLVVSVTPSLPINTTPIYTQNFDNAATAADAGVTPLYNDTLKPTIVDGKLSVPKTGWASGGPFGTLVGRETFASTPDKYVIEMDLEISQLGVVGFIFNGTTPAASDTKYNRNSAFFVALRLGSGVDKLTTGTIADKALTHDIYVRTAYFKTADAAQITDNKNDRVALALKEGDTKAALKLTIVVDSTPADGCQVNIFADGEFIYGYKMDNNFDVNANSYVSIWAQDAVFTIDNLVISKF